MDKLEYKYNNDVLIISKFLSDNYVEDDNNKFRYNYSSDFLKWYLNDSINISVYDNDIYIGFICGKKINLFLNKQNITIAEIDFLCIKKDYRNKKLCPILLNKIKEEFNKINIYDAIFTSEHKYLNQLSHTNYYIKFINPEYLYNIGYINYIPKMNEHKLKGFKTLLKLEKKEDYIKCFELYNKYFINFECYELFNEETFIKRFLNQHILTFGLMENNKIIDFISYYFININVLKLNKTTTDGYLYMYSNNSNNLHKMVLLLLHKLKENNIDTFIALDIMENNNVLEDLNFIKKESNFNYYLFDNNIKINNHKMAKILF